eukprot:6073637-Prymnesium_polylepis.1
MAISLPEWTPGATLIMTMPPGVANLDMRSVAGAAMTGPPTTTDTGSARVQLRLGPRPEVVSSRTISLNFVSAALASA